MAIAAFVLAVDVAIAAYPADPLADGNPRFCAPKEPVEDFGLRALPRVREVPEEAGKQLGRGAVDIYGGWDRVMSEPRSFGYGFSEHNYSGTVQLDWTIRAELWTVDRNGTAFEKVDGQELFIGRLDAAHQPFIGVVPPKARRGFYRFDMQIESAAGETIGSFGAFFKVVRPYWKVRLGLARDALRPGQRVFSRLENLGTLTASYGESFSVERFNGVSWEPQPEILGRKFWLLWGGILGPGRTGLCNSFRLPADMSPGRYRVVKSVGLSLRKLSRLLTAEFTVET
ncbi:MAG TPA: immunoglobulin-like domain-containing protein [Solirubrobacterales bacterium]|nr:immunoglobulin-like domain-containing protein [Solirubrobacterales bacterium]